MGSSRRIQRFRIKISWFHRADFQHLVKEVWNSHKGDISEIISTLTKRANWWRDEILCSALKRKKRCQVWLEGIQRALSQYQSIYLRNLEISSINEYKEILRQESLYWYQRSWFTWLKEGDIYSKFFHASVIAKRAKEKKFLC